MSEAKFSALIRKSGRLQWMPVPGCINSQEAREQAEQMYAGSVQQIRFDGRTKDFSSDESFSNDSNDSETSFGSILALLAVLFVITIVVNFWQYIIAGGAIILFVIIMKMRNS
jgi:hypothetical protein